ncbi:DNA-processing protein DprA [Microbacterium deminutum]|uniref:DNA-processing protein DprA n=1 Tax=Microbacterium deminutum TaxID=344164 RepID=A0ABN2R8H2_9MICO
MTAFDLTPGVARRALGGTIPSTALEDDAVLERYAVVVWSHLTEPGDGVAGRLVAQLGAAQALRLVMGDAPERSNSVTPDELAAGRKRWIPRLGADAVSFSLRIAAVSGMTILTRADPEWPVQLHDLGDHAPLCLWVRGDPARLRLLNPAVALVGARAATSYGDHVALELAADLAGGGIPVVSGGAYGIDGAAHRAAMAVGGLTVAMLAGGADRAYPAGHAQLIGHIAEAGVVASEVPCGSAPTKWRFLQRNRLIAALSAASVVVEAGWRSGALNTAAHAVSMSRGLGAVPGPITSSASAGTHRLMREFGATCITSAADVRELLGVAGAADRPAGGQGAEGQRAAGPAANGPTSNGRRADGRPPTDDAMRVRDALSTRVWREVHDLARRTGMATDDVEGILGLLLLQSEVIRSPAGWRALPRRADAIGVAGVHQTPPRSAGAVTSREAGMLDS